ncbi:MAG: hypothetical protein WC916_00205 [Candidatus Woesearchaeota archaeon]
MEKNVQEWLKKIEKAKQGSMDLSKDEDLSIALMNLVSLEEHFYFTAMKTDNGAYLDMLQQVREMRQRFMKKIVTDAVGEEWCISKHLLAASMRLIEVGTKEQAKKNLAEAHECFTAAFDLWSLFFAINLKMIDKKELPELAHEKKSREQPNKFSQMIKSIVDCCKEW